MDKLNMSKPKMSRGKASIPSLYRIIRAIGISMALVIILSSPEWFPATSYAVDLTVDDVVSRTRSQIASMEDLRVDILIDSSFAEKGVAPISATILFNRELQITRIEFGNADALSDTIIIVDKKNEEFTMYWPLSNTAIRTGLKESEPMLRQMGLSSSGLIEGIVDLRVAGVDMGDILSNTLMPSNEDIIYQSLGTETTNGTLCYRIKATPKSKNNQYWAKEWISLKDWIPVKIEFYDRAGNLFLSVELLNLRLNSGIKLDLLKALPPGAEVIEG